MDHHVFYDWRAPSPLFGSREIAYIESIGQFLTGAEHDKARRIEWFEINTLVDIVTCGEIPGLRGDPTIRERRTGKVYVRRFSKLRFAKPDTSKNLAVFPRM